LKVRDGPDAAVATGLADHTKDKTYEKSAKDNPGLQELDLLKFNHKKKPVLVF
jgi:hypothetical protein